MQSINKMGLGITRRKLFIDKKNSIEANHKININRIEQEIKYLKDISIDEYYENLTSAQKIKMINERKVIPVESTNIENQADEEHVSEDISD
jgi:hypothetical protein